MLRIISVFSHFLPILKSWIVKNQMSNQFIEFSGSRRKRFYNLGVALVPGSQPAGHEPLVISFISLLTSLSGSVNNSREMNHTLKYPLPVNCTLSYLYVSAAEH